MEFVKKLLIKHTDINDQLAMYLAVVIVSIVILLLCIIAQVIVKKIILKILTHYITKNRFNWDNIMMERNVFRRLSNIVPAIIIYTLAPTFDTYQNIIRRIVLVCISIIIVFVLNSILDSIEDIYKTFPVSKIRPIKGVLQIAKIVIYIVTGIMVIAILLNENPLVLLSGIGALTAVFSLVFKDSILGFVAGIQLTSNNMLHIGDWIEMPKYGADGDVIEITLNTVKVQNFDKTIVTIPSYALVSDSFKNWRGMQNAGGRRIKRSVYIDVTSIQFYTDEMIAKLKKIQYLSEYLEKMEKELKDYNKTKNIDKDMLVNGRRLTNIGTFRAYIKEYLKNHPKIHQNMTQMVRQLPPEEHGVPLEIYAFTNDIDWVVYEGIQADIFDHIFAVAEEFGLRIFQNPTGYDMQKIGKL